MSNREVFEWIEIDVPRCSRTFGTAPCNASLSQGRPNECYRTRTTCTFFEAYDETLVTTLRFSKVGLPLPKGFKAYPVLLGVRQSSAEINIAGSDPRFRGLGKRGSFDFECMDFTDHDRNFDFSWSRRVSGAAQFDGVGFVPEEYGMFFQRLKARWRNYQGANVRLCRAYVNNGVLENQTTYYHTIKSLDGPSRGVIRGEAIDILDLDTPLCPKPSRGVLNLDLPVDALTFDITPVEVANEYSVSGRITVGGEIMSFTRSGATFTVVRAQRGTLAKAHKQGDSVQENFVVSRERIDVVARRIFENFTNVPSSWLPLAEWAEEIGRWAGSLLLETDVTEPTPVGELLSELGDLGANIFPDDINQKIRLKMNRPVFDETIKRVTDDNMKTMAEIEEDPDLRLTQVLFCHKRIDPTKGLGTGNDTSNYASRFLTVNGNALDKYGPEARTRIVRTRWLDQGDEIGAFLVSFRLLKRFEDPPVRIRVTMDADLRDIGLADVVRLTTTDYTDTTGRPLSPLMQVRRREENIPYHEVTFDLQRFEFNSKYGGIAPNDTPVYSLASEDQQRKCAFMVDPVTLEFSDGSGPYRLI